jgi:hypothetical protein
MNAGELLVSGACDGERGGGRTQHDCGGPGAAAGKGLYHVVAALAVASVMQCIRRRCGSVVRAEDSGYELGPA